MINRSYVLINLASSSLHRYKIYIRNQITHIEVKMPKDARNNTHAYYILALLIITLTSCGFERFFAGLYIAPRDHRIYFSRGD